MLVITQAFPFTRQVSGGNASKQSDPRYHFFPVPSLDSLDAHFSFLLSPSPAVAASR